MNANQCRVNFSIRRELANGLGNVEPAIPFDLGWRRILSLRDAPGASHTDGPPDQIAGSE
jgi:hypothetical protein